MLDWQFTYAVLPDRAAYLRAWKGFDAIVDALLSSLRVGKFWWEAGRDERLKGCNRASFDLAGDTKLCDAFFNSPQGYRGQYARSVAKGESANRRLLDALERMLLHATEGNAGVTLDQVRASLRSEYAKVWIDETLWYENDQSDSRPAIVHKLWRQFEPQGEGLLAPVGAALVVKGGWLDVSGNVKADDRKRRRSELLHTTGSPR